MQFLSPFLQKTYIFNIELRRTKWLSELVIFFINVKSVPCEIRLIRGRSYGEDQSHPQ